MEDNPPVTCLACGCGDLTFGEQTKYPQLWKLFIRCNKCNAKSDLAGILWPDNLRFVEVG